MLFTIQQLNNELKISNNYKNNIKYNFKLLSIENTAE